MDEHALQSATSPIFKRGVEGVYQYCSEKYLHRYLAKFDFRYSIRGALGVDDQARTSRPERHGRQAIDGSLA